MKSKNVMLMALALATSFCLKAQKVETSVSQVISSKAAKGSLYDYTDENDKIKLTYLLKESKKSLDLETYTFDKATLKYEGSTEKEVDKTSLPVAKSGTTEGEQLLRIYPHIVSGKPMIQLGYMAYTIYPRYTLGKFVVREELVPKGDAGEKIFYVHHRTEEADNNQVRMEGKDYKVNVGDVQMIGNYKMEPFYSKYTSMVIRAKDLSYAYKSNFDLEHSMAPICATSLPNGDLGVVFRTYTIKDFPKPDYSKKVMAKFSLADKYYLKYVQISADGRLVKNVNIDMEQPESGYTMALEIVQNSEVDDILIMGTTRPLKILGPPLGRMGAPRPVYGTDKPICTHKADRFFVAKISGNELAYSKNVEVNALLSNIVAMEGTEAPKDLKSYIGKFSQHSLKPANFVSKDGKDLVIFSKANGTHNQVMQLSSEGDIEANYLLGFPKKRVMNRNMEVVKNGAGELRFIAYHQPAVKSDATSLQKGQAAAMRIAIMYGIDPSAKTVTASANLSPNGSLDLYNPYYIENENTIVTLGNGRKKEIILSRISLK